MVRGIGRGGSSQRRHLFAIWVIVASLLLALLPPAVEAGRSAVPAARQQAKAAPLAQVRYIKRGLAVKPPNKKTVKGKVKMSLFSRYGLATGGSQLASLGFKDGTVLHMNQRTNLVLRNPSLTYVNRGQVDEILTPGTSHRVQTATAIAAAIGTEFVVRERVKIREVKQGKGKKRHVVKEQVHTTQFVVVEGALQVTNAEGTVTVKTDQRTTVQEGKAPQPPVHVDAAAAVTWTASIPAPAVRAENLVLDANGGKVVGFSSQATASPALQRQERTARGTGRFQTRQATASQPFAATNINDGRLDTGWMSGKGQVTNQWVKLQLKGGNAYQIGGVVIEPSATNGADPSDAVRNFEIRVSTTGTADSDFTTVFTGAALEQHGLQTFTFPQPVDARYVELYGVKNHGGNDGIAVAELEVVGAPATVTPPTPTNTPTLIPTSTSTPTTTPTSTPTATSTATATATPTATPTNTPSIITITPFSLPSNTLVPTPTVTATSTPTPTPAPLSLGPGGETFFVPCCPDQTFSQQFTASGGTPPYNFSASGLPEGATLTPNSPTPDQATLDFPESNAQECFDGCPFTVTVTDASGQSASQDYTIQTQGE